MITEEKSCAARIERLVGTFSFTLDGWNELPDKVGESTESPEFELCGKLWQLRIFPGGSLENHVGFISYYLASKSSTVTRAAYKLIIKNQKQGGADEVFASSGIRKFEAKGVQVDGWGRDKFVSASQLKDPWLGFCVNDTVIFQVEIAVYGGLTPISPAVNLAGQSVLSLSQSIMRSMFDNKDSFSDVVIDVTGERIYAHKCILSARSPVFHCMLHGGMTESVTSIITINDIDADIIRELVSFIYSDIIRYEPLTVLLYSMTNQKTVIYKRWIPFYWICTLRHVAFKSRVWCLSARSA